jgi:hypothetical protein
MNGEGGAGRRRTVRTAATALSRRAALPFACAPTRPSQCGVYMRHVNVLLGPRPRRRLPRCARQPVVRLGMGMGLDHCRLDAGVHAPCHDTPPASRTAHHCRQVGRRRRRGAGHCAGAQAGEDGGGRGAGGEGGRKREGGAEPSGWSGMGVRGPRWLRLAAAGRGAWSPLVSQGVAGCGRERHEGVTRVVVARVWAGAARPGKYVGKGGPEGASAVVAGAVRRGDAGGGAATRRRPCHAGQPHAQALGGLHPQQVRPRARSSNTCCSFVRGVSICEWPLPPSLPPAAPVVLPPPCALQ